jgi:hypothetical protein
MTYSTRKSQSGHTLRAVWLRRMPASGGPPRANYAASASDGPVLTKGRDERRSPLRANPDDNLSVPSEVGSGARIPSQPSELEPTTLGRPQKRHLPHPLPTLIFRVQRIHHSPRFEKSRDFWTIWNTETRVREKKINTSPPRFLLPNKPGWHDGFLSLSLSLSRAPDAAARPCELGAQSGAEVVIKVIICYHQETWMSVLPRQKKYVRGIRWLIEPNAIYFRNSLSVGRKRETPVHHTAYNPSGPTCY